MDKCRLCLRIQKRLHSINATKDGISYRNMVHGISSRIKIDTRADDKVCITCCRKLDSAFNFKLMIERSDEELQNLSNTKRITFTTIEDIKQKIEIPEADNKLIKHEIIEQINSDNDEFQYNEILLRRKSSKKQPFNVSEFFNSIKEELDDTCDGYEVDEEYEPRDDHLDVDYVPGMNMQKHKKTKPESESKCTVRVHKKNKNIIFVDKPIKPKLYRNIKLKVEFCSRAKRNVEAKPIRKKPRQVCPYCGKLFTNMEAHILIHSGEKKFKCDICPKAFFLRQSLVHHRVAHRPKTIRCDECVAVFSTQSDLRSHKKCHSEVRNIVCEICSKGFKRRQQLYRHKAHMHNIGLKEYKCDHCEKTCKSSTLLKHHLRVHTGERPFKCEMCSQPYSYKHDFNRHCFKKHGVLFKRRSVYVMNEEVLMKERALMRDLMLRIKGVIKEEEPLNPFEGAQAAKAYDLITKALAAGQITLDFKF